MSEPSTQSNKLQWKWVGITLAMYAVFYLLPLSFFVHSAQSISGVWMFAGLIIVAAVAGYLSKGVTIWEPAIASLGLVFLFFFAVLLFVPPIRGRVFEAIIPMAMALPTVFVLSLLGAWLGERAQKLWKTQPPKST